MVEFFCGYRYFLTIVDACTKHVWLFLLKQKFEVLGIFKCFKTMIDVQFQHRLKSLQINDGGEYRPFTTELGIIHRISCLYTHHQNGTVERKHRDIIEKAFTLLAHARLPLKFWDHAMLIATFLINRLPSLTIDFQIPITILTGQLPDFTF